MIVHIAIPAASNLEVDLTFPMPETYDYWPGFSGLLFDRI